MVRRVQWSLFTFQHPHKLLSAAFCNDIMTEWRRTFQDEWTFRGMIIMVTSKVNRVRWKFVKKSFEVQLFQLLTIADDVYFLYLPFSPLFCVLWITQMGLSLMMIIERPHTIITNFIFFFHFFSIIFAIWIMTQKIWCHCCTTGFKSLLVYEENSLKACGKMLDLLSTTIIIIQS